MWTSRPKEALVVEKIQDYEHIVALIDTEIQRLLEATHYDTVHNFLDFYQSYRRSGVRHLNAFFQSYGVPINRRHHMCVSLGMEIISRVASVYPAVADKFYLVSCEEAVEDLPGYVEHCEESGIEAAVFSVEKEHALVAMRVQVAGRDGVMILDPGYHVARAVTVMRDQNYPHTGWFLQSDEPACKREYNYTFSSLSGKFVTWSERTTRPGGKNKHELSLVYVDRPYRTAVDVTVRRNLVYNFRSLLSRDAKGRVVAGLYFPVPTAPQDTDITLFYDGANEQSIKIKQKLSVFLDASRTPVHLEHHIEAVATQLRVETDKLRGILHSLAESLNDHDFVKQLLQINHEINEMSADN